MDIAYINEETAVVWSDIADDQTPYDIRQVVARMAAIRTMRDLVGFMLKTPASFFLYDFLLPPDTQEAYSTLRREVVTLRLLPVPANGGGRSARHAFRGSVADAVEKDFEDIVFLDGVVATCGELGPCLDLGNGVFGVYAERDFYCLDLRDIERVIQNVQSLLKLAAIANDDSSTVMLERLDVDCDAPVQFVDPGFVCSGGIVDDSALYLQSTELPDGIYSDKERIAIVEAIRNIPHPYSACESAYDDDEIRYPFVYPAGMTDREMAARAFVTFMEGMFFVDDNSGISNGTFRVNHDQKGFSVVDIPEPLHDALRLIATLAAEDSIRLCSHCGKNPVLTDRSRGVGAAYCSKSCKTMASKERRDQAYMMAAKGVPVDEAIERIGSSYEASVMRWYAEAEDLL